MRVFGWNGASWSQFGDAIYDESPEQYGYFGSSAVLSADGSTLVVGHPSADSDNGTSTGRVRTYRWDGTSWVAKGSATYAVIEGAAQGDQVGLGPSSSQGDRLALSADGSRLIIGEPYYDSPNGSNSGRAKVYYWNGSGWRPLGNEMYGAYSGYELGASVAFSRDGSKVVIGGTGGGTNNSFFKNGYVFRVQSLGSKSFRLRNWGFRA